MLGTLFVRLRRVMTIVVLAAFAATVLNVVSAPAARAASCYRDSCNGKSPVAEGCNTGATTVKEFSTGGWVRVELRYSAACRSAWTRITTSSSSEPADCNTLVGQLQRGTGAYQYVWGKCEGDHKAFTKMYDSGYSLRACASWVWHNSLCDAGATSWW